jgi:DNA-binding transcriptional ArsR family regulator
VHRPPNVQFWLRLQVAYLGPVGRWRGPRLIVAAHDGGEACVCDLAEPLGLTQPIISHHVKILADAGICTREKRGVRAYCSLVPAALDVMAAVLSTSR